MKVLVTGGAGYIGSHTCVSLIENGHEVIIADNFCNSDISVIEKIEIITGIKPSLYECDLCDKDAVHSIFETENNSKTGQIEAVIHFAGYKAVGESVSQPLKYYHNNILSTINLLDEMSMHEVKSFIFSSSATVYSTPQLDELLKQHPDGITEDFPLGTTNPYGRTKLMIEQILNDLYTSDNSWNIGILRYFNPIGAHESGLIGENPKGIPNNLLPYVAKVAIGELPVLNVFGNDYSTPDGTCIRDYVHVMDVAAGHIALLGNLYGLSVYNLGTGEGYSVLDVINTFEAVSGKIINFSIAERRAGDIPISYANVSKAKKELQWTATRDLYNMCKTAWLFLKNNQI